MLTIKIRLDGTVDPDDFEILKEMAQIQPLKGQPVLAYCRLDDSQFTEFIKAGMEEIAPTHGWECLDCGAPLDSEYGICPRLNVSPHHRRDARSTLYSKDAETVIDARLNALRQRHERR